MLASLAVRAKQRSRGADTPHDGEGRALLVESLDKMLPALRVLGESETYDAVMLMRARMVAPGVVTRAEGARALAHMHGAMAVTLARGAAEASDPAVVESLLERHRVALEEQRFYAQIAADGSPVD